MKTFKHSEDTNSTLENKDITDNSLHVLIYSPPRCGSTIVYNILSELVRFTTKTHENIEKLGKEKTIIVLRDPKEWISSYARTSYDLSEEQLMRCGDAETLWSYFPNSHPANMIDELMKPCLQKYNGMLQEIALRLGCWPEKPGQLTENVLCIKYEDFYKNYNYLFDHLESYLDIKISQKKRKEITSKVNIKAVKKITENYSSFKDFDPISFLHGNHICNYGAGTSQLLVPESVMPYFVDHIKKCTPSPWWRSWYPL